MTTLNLYIDEERYNNLIKSIETLRSYDLEITYEASKPDEHNWRDIKIETDNTYGLYRLGIEMGKLSTTI